MNDVLYIILIHIIELLINPNLFQILRYSYDSKRSFAHYARIHAYAHVMGTNIQRIKKSWIKYCKKFASERQKNGVVRLKTTT